MSCEQRMFHQGILIAFFLVAGFGPALNSISFSQDSWSPAGNSELEDVQRKIKSTEERITHYKKCIAQERPGEIILYEDSSGSGCMAISTQSFREYLKEKGVSPSEVQAHLKVWDEMSIEVRRRFEDAIVRMGAELTTLREKESQLKAQAKQQAADTAPLPMDLVRLESAGGTAEDYHAALKEVRKTEARIQELESEIEGLDTPHRELQQQLAQMKLGKKGSVHSAKSDDDVKAIEKEMAEIEEQKSKLMEEKERLISLKALQEKYAKELFPRKPWEGRPTPDPKDFQTQKDYAYEDWKWWDNYASNQAERDKARGDYEKQMAQIAKEEAAAQAQGGTSQMTPIVTGSGTASGATQGSGQTSVPIQPITTVKIPQTGGKETQAEIWDVGKNPPKSLFLTDDEIKAKKAWFKDNPYGFHEIKTQDSKVIDVVADKKGDADKPPVGFITVGEGKEAETTIIQYEEKIIQDASDKSTTVVSEEVKDKKTYSDGYLAESDRIVKDVNRGIEWLAGPDKDTDWDQANAWVTGLKVGGGGWRMPLSGELDGLYKKGRGARNIPPYLKTSGWYVWLDNAGASKNFFVYSLEDGGTVIGWGRQDSKDARAFAVRQSK